MHLRCALLLLACCAGLAAGGSAASGATVAVYGLELEVDAERERLLIFADAPLEARLIPVDDRTLMIALPGSVLDLSAPTHITPVVQGTVVRVTAFDRAHASGPPEVRVVVQRRPGAAPRIERRASVIALDFEAPPRLPALGQDDTIAVAYRDAELVRVITELAKATGESIVFDDALAGGAITIEGPPRVSRAEALALIDSVLLLRGFAAVPAPGGGRKVVPINGAPSPWAPDGELADSDAPVTTLLRLQSTNAGAILPVLTPYLGATAIGTVFEPTNSVILSGPASLLRQLRIAVEALDQLEAGRPLIWPLRYGNAEVVADQVLEILGERDVPYASSDERTNTVLLRVRPGEVERVRSLVNRLDRPASGRGELHVVKLRYADPELLVEQLHALRDDVAATGDETDPAAAREGLRGLSFEVVADVPTNSLVIRAPPETFDAIFDAVRDLDQVPVSVRVEVTIASLDVDDRLDLGVDYLIPTLTDPKTPQDLIATVLSNSSGGGIQTLPSADRPFVAAFTRAPLLLTFRDPTTGQPFAVQIPRESVSVTMNAREVNTELLMQPQLLLTSGEEHEIFAGDNIPIPVAQTEPTGPDAALQVQQNIKRQDVGTTLRVTPTVGAKGGVELALRVEVSALRSSEAGPVEEVGPTIRQIQVEAVIRLRHGEVAVIATAAQPTTMETETGVPWLKDIPWLGFAFRTTTEQSARRHLLIAVQAEILRPEVQELAERLARELGPLDPAARAER